MTLLENITDEKKRGKLHLFSRKLKLVQSVFCPCSLVTQRQQQTCNGKSIYTRIVIYRDESCLFLKPTLNNYYFIMYMWDDFLTAREQLVIFLRTYEFVHMVLSLCDEYIWRKEVCTKLFSWLPNVFKWSLWLPHVCRIFTSNDPCCCLRCIVCIPLVIIVVT